jgi:hypothetical protein
MGVEAVNHFKESFTKQGFTDKVLDKWLEVQRRKEGVWKGFQYSMEVLFLVQERSNEKKERLRTSLLRVVICFHFSVFGENSQRKQRALKAIFLEISN